MSGTVLQPQVGHSVKGSSVSQIIMKREVCLRGKACKARRCQYESDHCEARGVPKRITLHSLLSRIAMLARLGCS